MVFFAVVTAVVALVWWAGPGWKPRALPGVDRPRPWLLGHRGTRTLHEENTLPALEASLRLLDGLETDIRRTRDGVLVLAHDPDVGGLPVERAELDVLRDRSPGLATLADLLDLARRFPDTVLNLELKTSGRFWRSLAPERDLVRAVRTSGLQGRVLVSSFDPLALARVRLLAPAMRVALLTSPDAPPALRSGALARWLHVDAVHPHLDQIEPGLLSACQSRGLPVHAWTVNDPDRMRALIRAGVSALIGDDPHDLARYGRESAP